jgi:cytochrome c
MWLGLIALLVMAAAASGGAYLWKAEAKAREKAAELTGGDPSRGPDLMRRYGCAACHTVRGVGSVGGLVGPNLNDVKKQIYIAGVLTNTPQHLIAWIFDPQAANPRTAMPVTGISEAEARDVAAYLLSLR